MKNTITYIICLLALIAIAFGGKSKRKQSRLSKRPYYSKEKKYIVNKDQVGKYLEKIIDNKKYENKVTLDIVDDGKKDEAVAVDGNNKLDNAVEQFIDNVVEDAKKLAIAAVNADGNAALAIAALANDINDIIDALALIFIIVDAVVDDNNNFAIAIALIIGEYEKLNGNKVAIAVVNNENEEIDNCKKCLVSKTDTKLVDGLIDPNNNIKLAVAIVNDFTNKLAIAVIANDVNQNLNDVIALSIIIVDAVIDDNSDAKVAIAIVVSDIEDKEKDKIAIAIVNSKDKKNNKTPLFKLALAIADGNINNKLNDIIIAENVENIINGVIDPNTNAKVAIAIAFGSINKLAIAIVNYNKYINNNKNNIKALPKSLEKIVENVDNKEKFNNKIAIALIIDNKNINIEENKLAIALAIGDDKDQNKEEKAISKTIKKIVNVNDNGDNKVAIAIVDGKAKLAIAIIIKNNDNNEIDDSVPIVVEKIVNKILLENINAKIAISIIKYGNTFENKVAIAIVNGKDNNNNNINNEKSISKTIETIIKNENDLNTKIALAIVNNNAETAIAIVDGNDKNDNEKTIDKTAKKIIDGIKKTDKLALAIVNGGKKEKTNNKIAIAVADGKQETNNIAIAIIGNN